MKNFVTRDANQNDAPTYMEWLKATDNNADYGVYKYPTCNTVVVEKTKTDTDPEPVLMNSFHLVIMLEALAPKPGLSPKDMAKALDTLFDSVKRVAEFSGVREVYFLCADDNLGKFVERHGGEKVTDELKTYRFKLEQAATAGAK